jgi:uncharacterized protein (TIGR02145 family)
VPTDAEWTALTDYLGGEAVAGGKMKSVGTIEEGIGLWYAPNIDATNESGFTGLPGGFRDSNLSEFYGEGTNGIWWSSTEYDSNFAWYRYLNYLNGNATRDDTNKEAGFSVRCLRD